MADLDDEVARFAADAVAASLDRGKGSLDYSTRSLDTVEELLGEAALYAGDMESTSIDRLVQCMGCYILEVARLANGGKFYWHEQRDQPVLVVGDPAYHIALLTWDRVRQRLAGDPADNIPFFYAGFEERVRKAVVGDHVLYV